MSKSSDRKIREEIQARERAIKERDKNKEAVLKALGKISLGDLEKLASIDYNPIVMEILRLLCDHSENKLFLDYMAKEFPKEEFKKYATSNKNTSLSIKVETIMDPKRLEYFGSYSLTELTEQLGWEKDLTGNDEHIERIKEALPKLSFMSRKSIAKANVICLLEILAKDKSKVVRSTVAGNEKVDLGELLDEMLEDTDQEVRFEALKNQFSNPTTEQIRKIWDKSKYSGTKAKIFEEKTARGIKIPPECLVDTIVRLSHRDSENYIHQFHKLKWNEIYTPEELDMIYDGLKISDRWDDAREQKEIIRKLIYPYLTTEKRAIVDIATERS